MIHNIQNQMKCILLNKWLHDISLAQFRDQICLAVNYQTVNDVSACYYFQTDENLTQKRL